MLRDNDIGLSGQLLNVCYPLHMYYRQLHDGVPRSYRDSALAEFGGRAVCGFAWDEKSSRFGCSLR
jgi:hypothetical protein